ncbi:uncharacterized protein JN550_000858 [Neoarthrinium moseri]|uniref:uncharacterized protein n=1 Tax=Neoarthrinium moseri TaxID=1658444 RepID=UPI001FDBBDDC|nr:uncharacterized protein JN550_000858 [Neoarthrinium moseri]KAI1876786.1 hypothetical protein JN550_000858 [Neoarthrinium moseri]
MATSTSIRPVIGRILQHTNKCSPSTVCLAAASGSSRVSAAPFSTTTALSMRKPRRDNNRLRGLSSLYRSGTKGRMAVDGFEVPEPADYKPEEHVKTDPNHGLYQFFYESDKALLPPEEEAKHGRSWTVEELRHKNWDDLHRLWWVCVKERNRIATAARERQRLEFRTGEDESKARMRAVSKTMKAIKQALTERFYTWEDARQLAEEDPEVDLSNESSPYTPRSYLEEEVADPQALEAEAEAEAEAVVQEQQPGKPAEQPIDPSALPKAPATPTTTQP